MPLEISVTFQKLQETFTFSGRKRKRRKINGTKRPHDIHKRFSPASTECSGSINCLVLIVVCVAALKQHKNALERCGCLIVDACRYMFTYCPQVSHCCERVIDGTNVPSCLYCY